MQLRPVGRFRSIEDVVQRTGLRRDELTTLADVGALNAFTNERRSALWQVERAVRPSGELYAADKNSQLPTPNSQPERTESPLRPMSDDDRLQADYAGTGLTIGPHPMALRRGEMSLRGVLRAIDLPNARNGRRVRVAGMVITRQRPGTAKGFVFLTLEDETGISNVIVRPDLVRSAADDRRPSALPDRGRRAAASGRRDLGARRTRGRHVRRRGGGRARFLLKGRPEGRPLPETRG